MINGIPVHYFLILSAFVFCVGLVMLLTKKNAVLMLLGLELMLNAANINWIAFSYHDQGKMQGQFFALFILTVAVAEICVALALIFQIYKHYRTAELDQVDQLKN